MLTITQLNAAKDEYARTRTALSTIARRIEQMRGRELNPGFGLNYYSIAAFEKIDHSDVDPDAEGAVLYPAETPVIAVEFYHDRWCETVTVFFPQSYLDGTEAYLEHEQAAIAQRQIAYQQRKATELAEAEEIDKRARLETFERLKEEFEPR